MTTQDDLQQQLWDYVYELLPDEQARQLEEQITSDPDTARTYALVKLQSELLATAAKLQQPPVPLDVPGDEAIAVAPQASKQQPTRAAHNRSVGWFNIMLAAAALLLFLLTGFVYYKPDSLIRAQAVRAAQHQLAQQFTRTIITGPARWVLDADQRLTVTTTSLAGQPHSTRIRYRLYDDQGQLRLDRQARTDSNGKLVIDVPPTLVTAQARLEVEAQTKQGPAALRTWLQPLEAELVTYLSVDKPLYRPGEIVYCRSVTLSRYRLQAEQEMVVQYEITAPDGSVVAQSQAPVATQQGVGNDAFPLPAGLVGGKYTLTVRQPQDLFPQQQRDFLVRDYRAPRLKKELEFARDSYAPGDQVTADLAVQRAEGGAAAAAQLRINAIVDEQTVYEQAATTSADGTYKVEFSLPEQIQQGAATLAVVIDDGGTQETIAKTIPINLGKVAVDVYPEGGELVAGLTSRVYFYAHDPLGEPVHIAGRVVDDRGHEVAELETFHEGRGVFHMTPQAGRRYELLLDEPAGVTVATDLPPVAPEGFVVMETGAGLVAADQPVQLTLRSLRPEVPLVVAVVCRGVTVDQQEVLPEQWRADGTLEKTIGLPPEASGVLRLTVYDYSSSPPRPLAERLVYRRPARHLDIDVQGLKTHYAPGDTVELTLEVTDEQGQPAAAALGVSVVDTALLSLADEKTARMPTHFWLAAHIDEPQDLEDVNFYLSDDKQATRALDLLLGTQGWRRFVTEGQTAAGTPNIADVSPLTTGTYPPLVYDNLSSVEQSYQAAMATLAERQREQLERWGTVLLIISVMVLAGGLLVVVVGQAPHMWLWLPTVATAAGCLLLAALWGNASIDSPGGLRFAAMAMHGLQDEATPQPARTWLDDASGPDAEAMQQAGEQWGLYFNAPEGRADDDYFLWKKPAADRFGAQLDGRLGQAAGLDKVQDFVDGFVKPERFRADDMGFRYVPATPIRQYAHQHRTSPDATRVDFADMLFWHPLLIADESGHATVRFDLSDSITTFQVLADAHGSSRIGSTTAEIVARIPFSLEPKLPAEVTAGDRIELPVAINNDTEEALAVALDIAVNDVFRLDGASQRLLDLAAGQRARQHVGLEVVGYSGQGSITLKGRADEHQDSLQRTIRVVPRGFPVAQSYAGRIQGEQELLVKLPPQWIEGSLEVTLHAFPSSLADMRKGVEGLLQEPSGCFEQASSSHYPNVMAMSYMQQHGVVDPEFTQRAKELLGQGYTMLTGYESPQHGYEWFGGDPGHEALTAFGLMEFTDMSRVWSVDQQMLQRTARWLLDRRDGQGGFQRNPRALDSFGAAPQDITDAYIVWALAEAGQTGIQRELDHVLQLAGGSSDAYLVALAARAAGCAERTTEAEALMQRLVQLRKSDGHLEATDGTITRSGGLSMQVETTALGALAWLKSPRYELQARQALDWIVSQRQGSGHFGSTQATVLALKAMVEHAEGERREVQAGSLILKSDGHELARVDFPSDAVQPIELAGITGTLKPGDNQLIISLTGDNQMPFVMNISYRSPLPVNDPACPLRLKTKLTDSQVAAGERVGLDVQLANISGSGQPMTVAVIGLPAGLEARTAQLDELQKAGKFDYYEMNARELIFYWRSLGPDVRAEDPLHLQLDLIAEIPGRYTAPASRSYLYYTAEQKQWADPLSIEITK